MVGRSPPYLRYALDVPDHWSELKRSLAAFRWPRLTAEVVASDVRSDVEGYRDYFEKRHDGWTASIICRFEFDGPKDAAVEIPQSPLIYPTRHEAEAVTARFPVGSRLTIFVEPGRTYRARLRRPGPIAPFLRLIVAVGIVGFGIAAFLFFLFLAVYRSS